MRGKRKRWTFPCNELFNGTCNAFEIRSFAVHKGKEQQRGDRDGSLRYFRAPCLWKHLIKIPRRCPRRMFVWLATSVSQRLEELFLREVTPLELRFISASNVQYSNYPAEYRRLMRMYANNARARPLARLQRRSKMPDVTREPQTPII